MDALQVIAEPRRRRILQLVWDRERAAGDIAAHFDLTFGAVSQHLAVLKEHGLVKVRAEGNRRLYQADRTAIGDLAPFLESMWERTLDQLADAIEEDQA